MRYRGRDFTRAEFQQLVGDVSQIGGVRRFRYAEGPEDGLEAIEFRTGVLSFTVLPGRCMDIGGAEFQGINLVWRNAVGDSTAAFYEPEGSAWARTFAGGLLVTCGLTHAGWPDEDQGEAIGLHGRASALPARSVCLDAHWQGDDYVMWAQGRMRQATTFGENLQLTRRVGARLGEATILIDDVVENLGYRRTPHQILYHFNFGFPLLSPATRLLAPATATRPITSLGIEMEEPWDRFQPPTPGYQERVYFHTVAADEHGRSLAAVINPELAGGLGVVLGFDARTLPHVQEWKMMGQAEYCLAVEPTNSAVLGRGRARRAGVLVELAPGERVEYRLELRVVQGASELRQVEQAVERLRRAAE